MSKPICNKFFVTIMALLCLIVLANAQYTEKWAAPGLQYYGCENTDNDNSKEVLLCTPGTNNGYLYIIDGLTGIQEWTLGPWAVGMLPV